MIINLDYGRNIYIRKDTIMSYTHDKDKSCEYLEVNEVNESAEFRNWTPRERQNIVNYNLVCSTTQVTEHCCVELKDQNISQETRDRFEILKKKYPEVFTLSSQDIGHTNLVTMHVDMGDSPPICQMPYTLPLKHYNWVKTRNLDIGTYGSHQKEHQSLGQPNCCGTQGVCTW